MQRRIVTLRAAENACPVSAGNGVAFDRWRSDRDVRVGFAQDVFAAEPHRPSCCGEQHDDRNLRTRFGHSLIIRSESPVANHAIIRQPVKTDAALALSLKLATNMIPKRERTAVRRHAAASPKATRKLVTCAGGLTGEGMRDVEALTGLLNAAQSGDADAARSAYELVYAELKRRARNSLRSARPDDTLTPTALVHEVYLRFNDNVSRQCWRDRSPLLRRSQHRGKMRQTPGRSCAGAARTSAA